MMLDQVPWWDLALSLGPALVALAAYELICVRVLRRRVRELAGCCAALEGSVDDATRLLVRAASGERRVQGALSRLGERMGQLELRSEVRPYEQAISLAEQGEQAARLVSCFGLTEGEASLVSLLHGDRRPPPEA